MNARPTIAVDARLVGGTAGGVEQFVAGLAAGLSGLDDGAEQYLLLVHRASVSWLTPYVAGPCTVTEVPLSPSFAVKALLARLSPTLRRGWWRALERVLRGGRAPSPPRCGRALEKLGADLIHFTRQQACLTEMPSIYHPHDLLHLHFPGLLDAADVQRRDATYGEHCHRASMVAVASSWTKHDVVTHYGLPEEKVHVVPYAPTIAMEYGPSPAEVETARRHRGLPDRYVLYPAQMWPHKNHVGLLGACSVLRERHGLEVPLVFSGRRTEYTATVLSEVRRLGLEGLVTLTGHVSARQLRCLYAASVCVAVPSMFEAGSFPMWDAFLAGVPVAASTATSLPRQAGGAAVLFDPTSTVEIAEALASLWTSAALREELVAKGREVVRPFTWERTARHFRAHYRRILDLPMTDADRGLLRAPPLL